MSRFIFVLLIGIFIISGCAKQEDWNTRSDAQATIYIKTEPGGAQIFLSGRNTNKTTPEVISNLSDGDYNILLRKEGFLDTAFTVSIINQKSITRTITLRDNLAAEITYIYNLINNVVNFNIKFNQYVQLTSVEFFMPSGTSGKIYPNVIFEDNKTGEFVWYQQAEKGVWKFHLSGQKLWSRNILDQDYEVLVDY